MPDQETDSDLVSRLVAGETAAFEQAYASYRARIFSFLVRLSGHRTLAEDLVQETFLRLARYAPRLRPDSQLGPWLYRVARNLFVSHQRWKLLDAARVAEAKMYAGLRPPPPTPFALHAADETQRRLEQALSELPLRYREVLLLVLTEGLSNDEAAAVVGVPPATLRQRLKRGRDKLKEALSESNDP